MYLSIPALFYHIINPAWEEEFIFTTVSQHIVYFTVDTGELRKQRSFVFTKWLSWLVWKTTLWVYGTHTHTQGVESSIEFTIAVQSAEIKASLDSCFVASEESVIQGLLNMFFSVKRPVIRQFYSNIHPLGNYTHNAYLSNLIGVNTVPLLDLYCTLLRFPIPAI